MPQAYYERFKSDATLTRVVNLMQPTAAHDESSIEKHFDDYGFYLHGFEEEDREAFFQAALALAAAPQPAQADARVGLTAAARATIMDACQSISQNADGVKAGCAIGDEWPDAEDKAFYDAELQLLARLVALLNDPGQPEPRAEVTHGDTTMGECMASLLDRLEAAELYADRYRYLRERPLNAVSVGGVFAGKTPDNVVLNGADLDAAIDAAIDAARAGGA
ncbi:hypothetical protein [Burkholderia thailandensis]|uniref:hypothetical protein n=1 Tax=Burkholderia thailandensis TaxID=57975 RepID=UPI000FD814C9|nr:hypothetical protein [Burkholderia thailandensis]